MTDNRHPSEDQLLDELRAALGAADPVPDDVLAAAKASFTWRTIDAELATLTFDSATDELVGVRGEGSDRHVTFAAPDLEVEVMVYGTVDRRLTGQLVPPQAAVVELLSDQGVERTEADEHGAFAFDAVPPGAVSLRLIVADGERTVTTEWLVL